MYSFGKIWKLNNQALCAHLAVQLWLLHAATISKRVAQHSAQNQQHPPWAAYRSGAAIARPTTRFTRLALGAQTVPWPGSRAISRSCISSRLVVACKGTTSKHNVRVQPGQRVHNIQVHSRALSSRTHGCALPPHPGGIATNDCSRAFQRAPASLRLVQGTS